MRPFSFGLRGIASDVGKVISIDEWADVTKIPHRHQPDASVTGDDVRRIFGIDSKCWEPERFSKFETIQATAAGALRSARLEPGDIDAVFVVTCTPFEIMLDQDSFRLCRELEIPDHVAPIQLGGGCGGLARAAAAMELMAVETVLMVAYHVTSPFAVFGDLSLYTHNRIHPLRDLLWTTAAVFSDGVAAVVLSREAESTGFVGYSRDSQSFNGGPGFESTLVLYKGGGVAVPPGSPDEPELSCYAMDGDAIKEYYITGMMLNHAAICEIRPDYLSKTKRFYPHQASPPLVDAFIERAGFDRSWVAMNGTTHGNMVTPCTLRMIHDDLASGLTQRDDSVCLSVVGAGPERGAVGFPLRVKEVIPPGGG